MNEEKGLEALLNNGARALLDRLQDEREREVLIEQLWEASQSRGSGKAIQKSAKKVLYMLRSGGIDVDRYKPVRRRDSVDRGERLEIDSALLSIPDGLGNSQLIIALAEGGGSSLTLYRFVVNSLRGVLQFSRTGGSRKLLHRVQEDGVLFPVSYEYARYRLGQALDKTDRERVSGLSMLPALLEGNGGQVEHPVRAMMGTQISRIVSPAEERKLFSLAEIGGMVLPEDDVAEIKKQVSEARESRLVLANKTPEERVREIVNRFYKTYFSRERLEDLSNRLLDTALAFHHRGMPDVVRLLADYADSLLSPAMVPDKHPLLNFLVYKAFMHR